MTVSPTPTQISHEILRPDVDVDIDPAARGRVHRHRGVAAAVDVPVDALLTGALGSARPRSYSEPGGPAGRPPGAGCTPGLPPPKSTISAVADSVEVAGRRRRSARCRRTAACRRRWWRPGGRWRRESSAPIPPRWRRGRSCPSPARSPRSGSARCRSSRSRRRRGRRRGRRSRRVPPSRIANPNSPRMLEAMNPAVRPPLDGAGPGHLAPGRLNHPPALSGSRPTSVAPFSPGSGLRPGRLRVGRGIRCPGRCAHRP